jgi:NADP-dependent aldehyde dehydrogenase
VDPTTGRAGSTVFHETSTAEVAHTVGSVSDSWHALREISYLDRARALDAIADAVEGERDGLIGAARAETGFSEAKLSGELTRAVMQFRFFADVIREGSFLELAIDHARENATGPMPDLRRRLVPLGVIAVFGASNFPFAFSVLGGDTASALAAGNSVVVKAHSSHPETSDRSFAILKESLAGSLDAVPVGQVLGLQAGLDLVADPRIRAVGFTGSLEGGRALMDAIGRRPDPIPFYGELSSINPVLVTPRAAAEMPLELGKSFAESMTLAAGQMCTKPGVLFVPEGAAGDTVVGAAVAHLESLESQVLLNSTVYESFLEAEDRARTVDRLARLGRRSPVSTGAGFCVNARVYEGSIQSLVGEDLVELFGPSSMVVRYDPDHFVDDASRLLAMMPGSLSISLHLGSNELDGFAELREVIESRCGRIVYNGFPTGVAVAWSQTHGGPWPSTNSVHTSVGAASMRRFLRPVTYQDAPAECLPWELRDEFEGLPRRVDGCLQGGIGG